MEWLTNFGMREWLISCGIVLVLVVLADGFRRMRAERKGEIKMSLRMGGEFPDLPAEESSGSTELPNGGARVVGRTEPGLDQSAGHEFTGSEETREFSDMLENAFDPELAPKLDTELELKPNHKLDNEFNTTAAFENFDGRHSELGSESSDAKKLMGQQQILVMHAKSRAESGFNGSDLLQILLACDLRYGDRDILHRHENAGGEGQLQFSVANMVEPGTFNLEDISSFRTPGVTFFMTVPGADSPEEAFDCMLETANCLAKNLDAELLDDANNELTPQTIEDYRERVRSVSNVPA